MHGCMYLFMHALTYVFWAATMCGRLYEQHAALHGRGVHFPKPRRDVQMLVQRQVRIRGNKRNE